MLGSDVDKKATNPDKGHNVICVDKYFDYFGVLLESIQQRPNLIEIPKASTLSLLVLNTFNDLLEVFKCGELEIIDILW